VIVSDMVVDVDEVEVVIEVAISVVTIVATVFPVRMTRLVLMLVVSSDVDAAGANAKRL